jgi:hypothetical protein
VLSGRHGLKSNGLARDSCCSSLFLLFCHVLYPYYSLGNAVKWLLMSSILFTLVASSKEKIEYRCVRWAWTGDVYNRKVVCLEWQKVDKR